MGLSMEEKGFLAEHYFHSYGSGRKGGPSLKKVAEQFQEKFNKTTPSNTVMLSIVTKFRRSGSVFCQRKESDINCEDPPGTLPALSEKIISFCRSMQQPLFQDMFENLRERSEHCLQRGGAHSGHLHCAYRGKSTH
ncbi:hypothetical protein HNY73_004983 [Argiope bruennichi]|uniref:DUF4817 domain-containing protein n=1 Tax=Argiope bruennichi TaxID=94029 RepID=A0A8T0FQX9_ARGBR|nr:hypothetical protein HNY73_004983 [Argiope bruennichi]